MDVGFASKCGSMTRRIRGTNGIPVHKMLLEEREDRHRAKNSFEGHPLVEMERALVFRGTKCGQSQEWQGKMKMKRSQEIATWTSGISLEGIPTWKMIMGIGWKKGSRQKTTWMTAGKREFSKLGALMLREFGINNHGKWTIICINQILDLVWLHWWQPTQNYMYMKLFWLHPNLRMNIYTLFSCSFHVLKIPLLGVYITSLQSLKQSVTSWPLSLRGFPRPAVSGFPIGIVVGWSWQI